MDVHSDGVTCQADQLLAAVVATIFQSSLQHGVAGSLSQQSFPDRVRLMDNSVISLPQFAAVGNHSADKDVATAIALRIFAFVGKQVAEWRSKGQVGNIKGLRRGDNLEPNFELVAYTDWGKEIE